MYKSKTLTRMLSIATFAMMFSAGGVQAAAHTASSKPDATTKDAAGKTDANRAGQMSPTGENETTSARPPTGK